MQNYGSFRNSINILLPCCNRSSGNMKSRSQRFAGPWRVLLLSLLKEKLLTGGRIAVKESPLKKQTTSKDYHCPRICPLPAFGAVVKRLSNHLLESHNMEKDVFYYLCLKSAVIYSPSKFAQKSEMSLRKELSECKASLENINDSKKQCRILCVENDIISSSPDTVKSLK